MTLSPTRTFSSCASALPRMVAKEPGCELIEAAGSEALREPGGGALLGRQHAAHAGAGHAAGRCANIAWLSM